jgi:capping protein alpha
MASDPQDDEVYPEASPQTKINIATYFIMSSPTGEVNDVVKDVISLVSDPSVLTDERINSIMQEYNTQQMVAAVTPSGNEALVTVYGQVDNSSYLDPATGKVLKFDHRTQKFVSETDQKQVLPPEVAAARSAIEKSIQGYVDSSYRDKKAVIGVYGNDDGKITICISAKNVRLSSYWTGGIRCCYQVDVSKSGLTDLTASIKMNVHYFEDGNVQLHTDLNKTAKIAISDPNSTAKAIAAAVDKLESEFHANLEELYVNMHSNTFKAMRRFLPISGVPMNWNTSVHSLASEVSH